LKPAQENSSQDPISEIARAKWTGGVAKEVEHLLSKHKAEFNLQICQERKRETARERERERERERDPLDPLVLVLGVMFTGVWKHEQLQMNISIRCFHGAWDRLGKFLCGKSLHRASIQKSL
jgi:hypothetical protein